MGPAPLHRKQSNECRNGNCQRKQRGIRQMVHDAQDVPEEAFLSDVYTEQLRHLIKHYDEPYASLEACQNGRGKLASLYRTGRSSSLSLLLRPGFALEQISEVLACESWPASLMFDTQPTPLRANHPPDQIRDLCQIRVTHSCSESH